MADVQGRISRRRLASSASERQQLMLQTIRSLLQDGLVEVGDIPAPSERIVDRYDDPDSWEYST